MFTITNIRGSSGFRRVRRAALVSLAVPACILAAACTGGAGAAGSAGLPGPPGPAATAASTGAEPTPLVPSGAAIDVHTHLASQPLTDALTGGGVPASTADDLVARLDEANVWRAVVLSAGYMGWPIGLTDDSNMAPENDFVSAEVMRYPDRLIGFCGINPLFESAVAEVERCLGRPGMAGVKLHMGGSGVDLTQDEHVAAVSAVLDRAQEHDAPVLIHEGTANGLALDAHGLTHLAGILREHPDLRVVHAHCAGSRDDQGIEQWIRNGFVGENSFVEGSACLRYFRAAPLAQRELIVWRFRQWGIDRVLFGSDYLMVQPRRRRGKRSTR